MSPTLYSRSELLNPTNEGSCSSPWYHFQGLSIVLVPSDYLRHRHLSYPGSAHTTIALALLLVENKYSSNKARVNQWHLDIIRGRFGKKSVRFSGTRDLEKSERYLCLRPENHI